MSLSITSAILFLVYKKTWSVESRCHVFLRLLTSFSFTACRMIDSVNIWLAKWATQKTVITFFPFISYPSYVFCLDFHLFLKRLGVAPIIVWYLLFSPSSWTFVIIFLYFFLLVLIWTFSYLYIVWYVSNCYSNVI